MKYVTGGFVSEEEAGDRLAQVVRARRQRRVAYIGRGMAARGKFLSRTLRKALLGAQVVAEGDFRKHTQRPGG